MRVRDLQASVTTVIRYHVEVPRTSRRRYF